MKWMAKKKKIDIVSHGESDIKKNKTLYEAPIARAMEGKKEGDLFKKKIGENEKEIEIKKIKPIKD